MPMKNCDKFKRRMSEFLDGELRGTLKREFEEHIKKCRVCSNAVTRLQNIRSSLRQLSPIKTSPDFDAMLRARIRLTSSARWRNYGGRNVVMPWRIPAFALGTIVVVIVAALSFFFYSFNPDSWLKKKRSVSSRKIIERINYTWILEPEFIYFSKGLGSFIRQITGR